MIGDFRTILSNSGMSVASDWQIWSKGMNSDFLAQKTTEFDKKKRSVFPLAFFFTVICLMI